MGYSIPKSTMKGGGTDMGDKHIGTREVSFPVHGVEASVYKDHGWGLVSEESSAFGKDAEEAIERVLEKDANERLNK